MPRFSRIPGHPPCSPLPVSPAIRCQTLFENVNVKFGDGNRYGLIGANGCGKSTFMKILAGELEPTAGNISLDPGERMACCARTICYEDQRVLDVVMEGHAECGG